MAADIAEQFKNKMRDIAIEYTDPEICHKKMIELVCETLESFGLKEGVQIFKETEIAIDYIIFVHSKLKGENHD